jgi:hypothetical protein
MPKGYDDIDEFEFNDNEIVQRMLREQAREERRMASRRRKGPGNGRHPEDDLDFDDEDYDDDFDDDDDDDYDDYDEDEFDEYAGDNWR